jgi:glycosyltransferase involved in cell wall biosynthesis
MSSDKLTSACWLLPDLGHYHHARIHAAAAGPVRAYVLEAHDRPGFAEFRYVPSAGANYTVERAQGSIAESLDRLRPSVIFLNGWAERYAMAGLKWCLRSGTPAVVMSESTAFDSINDREADPGRPIRRRWWREAIKRKIVPLYSAALVGGTPHREYIVGLGMPPDRVFDGYDVVDNRHFAAGADAARANAAALRSKHSLPDNYFLASGRFIQKKNFARLLRAFAAYRISAGSGAWDLVLLGDGPEKPALDRLIDELKLGAAIRRPGFRSFDELPIYYGLAGAFVHASTTEQWGLVVNEAMASGLPVLVSRRCGCATDLVTDGLTGFQFDPYDEKSLTHPMLKVADSKFDRAAMGVAARRRIAEWGPERFAANFWRAADCAMRADPRRSGFINRLAVSLLGS